MRPANSRAKFPGDIWDTVKDPNPRHVLLAELGKGLKTISLVKPAR